MERAQKPLILRDLQKKIVMLVGPRQAGKTWLAKNIAQNYTHSVYLNYDQMADRKIITEQSWLDNTELLILDELHKMPNWKNYLKGLFDTKPATMHLLVTGSAKLQVFDQLGDSLAGRYFRHRLLPFSLSELKQTGQPCDLTAFLEKGPFPEPFLMENQTDINRWRAQYINSLLSTDVFEFDKVHHIKAMQLLFQLLRSRVGSPISYQSLAEDIGISPITVKKYIQILEALYIVFSITPYSKNIARSLLKEPKLYFYDTALVQGDNGAKLENFIAFSLLKHCYGKMDYHAENYRLHYLRTKDGQEVDFALIKDDSIEQLIEVKYTNDSISKSLSFFSQKYDLPSIQLVLSLRHEYQKNILSVLRAQTYLENLFM